MISDETRLFCNETFNVECLIINGAIAVTDATQSFFPEIETPLDGNA